MYQNRCNRNKVPKSPKIQGFSFLKVKNLKKTKPGKILQDSANPLIARLSGFLYFQFNSSCMGNLEICANSFASYKKL